jgi:hypothetical protein
MNNRNVYCINQLVVIIFILLLVLVKKEKSAPAHAVNAYRGRGDTAPLILNLGTTLR